jgi:hypothetical protein
MFNRVFFQKPLIIILLCRLYYQPQQKIGNEGAADSSGVSSLRNWDLSVGSESALYGLYI